MVTEDVIFAATGVTDGSIVQGARRDGEWIETETILMRSKTGSVRRLHYRRATSDAVARRPARAKATEIAFMVVWMVLWAAGMVIVVWSLGASALAGELAPAVFMAGLAGGGRHRARVGGPAPRRAPDRARPGTGALATRARLGRRHPAVAARRRRAPGRRVP